MDFNFFDNIPNKIPHEIFEEIFKNDNIKIERIISKGHISPDGFWYEQETNEWVFLLEGEAELEFQDKKKRLHKGDCLLIPKNQKHRVSYTSEKPECLWLTLHFK